MRSLSPDMDASALSSSASLLSAVAEGVAAGAAEELALLAPPACVPLADGAAPDEEPLADAPEVLGCDFAVSSLSSFA